LYNFIAFRSQPLLPKAEAKHLLGSIAGDVMEAMSPGLDAEVKTKIVEPRVKDLGTRLTEVETILKQKQDAIVGKPNKEQNKELKEARKGIHDTKVEIAKLQFPKAPDGGVVSALRTVLNLSNPVTVLGADMMFTGLTTLAKNFKDVRKMRKEKGGLEGKKVFMPKKDSWQDRGGKREKWQPNKDKVYFGRSNMTPKQQDEYDLKSDL
jgi:hypothetical protein